MTWPRPGETEETRMVTPSKDSQLILVNNISSVALSPRATPCDSHKSLGI